MRGSSGRQEEAERMRGSKGGGGEVGTVGGRQGEWGLNGPICNAKGLAPVGLQSMLGPFSRGRKAPHHLHCQPPFL